MSAVYFLLLLGGLIFFHELGHFLVAKASGVKVLTFAIGFGPSLLRKQWGETEYKIGLIPLGGYVKMYGDEPDFDPSRPDAVSEGGRKSDPLERMGAVSAEESPSPEGDTHSPEDAGRAFNAKPLWTRSLIVLAGPVFNLILPFIVFFFLFLTHSELNPAVIGAAIDGGPADKQGIQSGDVVSAVDGEPIQYWWELEERIKHSPGVPLAMTILRGDEELNLTVTPDSKEVMKLKQMDLRDTEGQLQIVSVFPQAVVWVRPGSLAEKAGLKNWDRIVEVDGEGVHSFAEAIRALSKAGSHQVSLVREVPMGAVAHGIFNTLGDVTEVTLPAGRAKGLESAALAVHDVDEGSPAAELGLTPGALIVTLDGYEFPFWFLLEGHLQGYSGDSHSIKWEDADGVHEAEFTLTTQTEKGDFNVEREVVVFGAYNHSLIGMPALVDNDRRLAYSLHQTWKSSYEAFRITLYSVGGLVVGRVPMKEMGGPILIYDMASKTEEHGWEYFFTIMVWLSISLGLINLFPVPILDGGHLMFFAIEAIIRRPVPLKVREIAAYVGLVLILLLMIVVFKNDIMRNWDQISGWF